jgi:DNA polymerase-4
VANLDDADAIQLILPFERRHRSRGGTALDTALDDIRSRFGTDALTRAVLLGRHDHFDVPLLPD